MKIKALYLKGMTGIKRGLGLDEIHLDFDYSDDVKLVALCGPNGSAKTTILDNAQPYAILPSRSATKNPSGFNFWKHICAPTAEKTLWWDHRGMQLKSHFLFQTKGKTQKAQFFLLHKADDDNWEPVTFDGITSDGKQSTYDLLVSSLCGKPEVFFMSNFSDQKSKMISECGAGQFKKILSDILGLENLQKLSDAAGVVVKLLRARFEAIRPQLETGTTFAEQVEFTQSEICEKQQKVESLKTEISNLEQSKEKYLIERAAEIAKRQENEKQLNEFVELTGQKESLLQRLNTGLQKLREGGNSQVHQNLLNQISDRLTQIQNEIQTMKGKLRNSLELTQKKDELQVIEIKLAEINAELDANNGLDAKLHEASKERENLSKSAQFVSIKLSEIKREGKGREATIADLEKRSGLIAMVPCSGQLMSSKCPLLRDAHDASKQVSTEQAANEALLDKYRKEKQLFDSMKPTIEVAERVEGELRTKYGRQLHLMTEKNRLTAILASKTEIERAERDVVELKMSIASHEQELRGLLEKKSIALQESREEGNRINIECEALKKQYTCDIEVIDARLSKFQKFDDTQLAMIEKAILGIQQLVSQQSSKMFSLIEEISQKNAYCKTLSEKIESLRSVQSQAEKIHQEMAQFTLLSKALGKDGLIAYSIDDAGPEITSICNQIMSTCFESRFSVRLDTQKQIGTGEMRETLQIKVFDNHRGGEEQDLELVSGGEEVWINIALIRAIALYARFSNPHQTKTLYSDETDGPLDETNKRNFVALKRYVMETGGYDREFYISHTPELIRAADKVIDLPSLAAA